MVSSLISSISGTLGRVGPDWADVAVGGVTFRVNTPTSTAEVLGRIGDRVDLFTSLHVREGGLSLFGFATEEARLAFEVLIGINGVGPRVALSVLSRLTPGSLAEAVSVGDMDAFDGVPGVGKKTASRIVLELKGKLGGEWTVPSEDGFDVGVTEALTSLGYTIAEARFAVASLPHGLPMSVEDRVLLALQQMGGN